MIMPRLAFEEPKGGPLAKAAREAAVTDQVTDQQGDRQAEPSADAEQLEDLFVEEPLDGPRHRRQPTRDTVLVILKGATVAVVLALVGVVILLATTGEGEPEASPPGVPQIETSGTPGGEPAAGTIVIPEVRSQTTELSVAPPPVTQPTLPTTEDDPPGPGNDDFVRVGQPCDTPGAYAFTERFEPVVCDRRGPNGRLAWQRMFR
jgi:hypothetical protein